MEDIYKTIEAFSEGIYTEKRSKFIACAFPVSSEEKVKKILDEHKKKYYDARHICWAYMLGHERKDFRSNDDGEPSGTAGKPILGQINSNELTDILILVIRYFGGTKLGTSGLIVAYREAASLAIQSADIVEKTVDDTITIQFDYEAMNSVMKIMKDTNLKILDQNFDLRCSLKVRIRQSLSQGLINQLNKVEGVSVSYSK